MNLKQAFKAGPGPNDWKQAFILWLKGVAMGSADIIPGVSGGTIAFITGIYNQLITAIASFNARFFRSLFGLKFAEALAEAHVKFLIPLFLGIAMAIVSTARLMNYLLNHHPVEIWSLFFGLIAASILVVGRQIPSKGPAAFACMALGALLGFLIVGLIPVHTPESLWFIFLCGVVSICAMILPGVSGAFILLILGKYAYVTGALKNPLDPGNLLVILVFVAGAALGLAGFSRLLKFLFTRFPNATIATLTGFMIGAMRKVWPWKEVLESTVIRGKTYVLEEANILPRAFDGGFFLALALMLAGFAGVMLLDRLSRNPSPPLEDA